MQIKKKWKKPKLLILIKSSPEEYCLGACKDDVGGFCAWPCGSLNNCRTPAFLVCPENCSTIYASF